jgi:hypothetical protein
MTMWGGDFQMAPAIARPVRLGKYAVPEEVTVTMSGAKGAPDLSMRFEVRDGSPECVDLHVHSKPNGRGIRTSDVAVFNLDAMAESVFLRFAMTVRKTETGAVLMKPLSDDDDWDAAYRDVYNARRSTRAVVNDAELRQVAAVYRDHVGGNPTKAVVEILNYSPRTAARRVRQARDRHLLPETTRGKKHA